MEKFGKIDVLLASAVENLDDIDLINGYVEDGGILLTTPTFGVEAENVIQFITDAPNIIRKVPSVEEPLTFRALTSFALLIFILTIAGARKIDLYGADGGYLEGELLYWGGWPSGSRGRLEMDTRILNQAFPIIMKRVCDLYGIEEPDITNHSERSLYTCFKKP